MVTPRIIVQSDAYYLILYREEGKEAELLKSVVHAAKEGYKMIKVSNESKIILNLILLVAHAINAVPFTTKIAKVFHVTQVFLFLNNQYT